jgi:hypothetical protein
MRATVVARCCCQAHRCFTSPFGLNPATEQVRSYWQALLEGLGIPSSQIRFE